VIVLGRRAAPLADQIPIDIRRLGISHLSVVADIGLQQQALPVPDEVGGGGRDAGLDSRLSVTHLLFSRSMAALASRFLSASSVSSITCSKCVIAS